MAGCEPDDGNKLTAYINQIGEVQLHDTVGDPSLTQKESGDFSYFQILDVNPDTLFSGDVVQGAEITQNAGGLLPINLKRNGGTVTITQVLFQDPNAITSLHLDKPDLESFRAAEQRLLTQKFVPQQSGIVASS